MSNRIKKCYNFVASLQQTLLIALIGIAIFVTTYTAKAENHRLSNFNGCYSLEKVIVCCKTKGDSLNLFTNLNFLFMQQTTKNASAEKNSNAPASKPLKGIYPNYSKDISAIDAINKRYDILFDECTDPSIKLSIMQVQLSLAESINYINQLDTDIQNNKN